MFQESGSQPVTVIITAYNAEATVVRAVRSALQSPLVERVIVVNDASTDDTSGVLRNLGDLDGRLLKIEFDRNSGPAAGRNHALSFAHTPFVALLDADDFFLPGRLELLLAETDWDMIADNILFVSQGAENLVARAAQSTGRQRRLSLEEFATRNISKPGNPRGELGFLKPVFKKEFLEQHHLAYDEFLRLGEDFLLYVQALAANARFLLHDTIGYVAVERADSLSAVHRTTDLEALASAAWQVYRSLPSGPGKQAMRRHNRQLEVKARHRRLLDDKARVGFVRSIGHVITAPKYLLPIARSIYADKRSTQGQTRLGTRTLFGKEEFDRVG